VPGTSRFLSRCLPFGEVERLDRELAGLGRGTAALRLRVGDAIEALAKAGGHHDLGFACVGDYARERCAHPARWAADLRAMARRLASLPLLREALVRGEISWSMAEVVSRHATAETEAELVEQARRETVRAMRARLGAEGGEEGEGEGEGEDENDDEKRCTLTVTVPTEDAWAVEVTRILVAGITGSRSNETLVEAMLAEGLLSLQNLLPKRTNDDADLRLEDPEAIAAWRAELARWRREAEETCEGRLEKEAPAIEVESWPELPSGALALDAEIRDCCARLAERDVVMGDLARRFFDADGWRRLGYASEWQYVRERVGVSHASLKARMTLSRRAARLPAVAEAVLGRSVGYEAAALVARVATPMTVGAWLGRARERTFKHLREEVEAVETLARVTGDSSVLEPPDDEMMREFAKLESDVLSGEVFRRVFGDDGANSQMSVGLDGDAADVAASNSQMSVGAPPCSASSLVPRLSCSSSASSPSSAADDSGPGLRPGAGKVTLRFNVREDQYWFWRTLETHYARTGLPWRFVSFLCLAVWEAWKDSAGTTRAYADVHARDRYRCASPVCSRRDITPHHLRFRSHGGGDEEENLVSACVWCHLEGIHGGRLRAEPPASSIRWTIGRNPLLVVDGRTRTLTN